MIVEQFKYELEFEYESNPNVKKTLEWVRENITDIAVRDALFAFKSKAKNGKIIKSKCGIKFAKICRNQKWQKNINDKWVMTLINPLLKW